MNAPSFKQLIKDGTAKRADAMKFKIEDIHEEPGFNLRREGEDLEESIAALAEHILAGGMVPALEVRPRAEGGVYLVDGHRRRRAYLRVADQLRDSEGELWVPVVAFTGNDADRIARVITSAEGRSLSQLEIADGYSRMIRIGLSPDEVAKKVNKTRQHVDQLLHLANANTDVQKIVQAGTVSATTAIKVVREHGENAGQVLKAEAEKAAAAGKKKVTAATMKGKPIPRAITDDAMASLGVLHDVLTVEDHETLATLDLRSDIPRIAIPADVVFELVELHRDALKFRDEQAAKLRDAASADAKAVLA
ncbi:ParB-like partition protein [Xanthomonas phage FoX2]|uniref:ParB/Spo0J HTH domain-containing protein n=1 Tax=Xanthomonas phage FoX2 TaxID=2723898 RepID=A0A858NPJ7_9CAUD|nr:ParB-like partition protein [Xanthomonas phage FoX2]QJB21862.1 hypothetical protein XccvBFoX2_gp43 [Xanthomonas phage FoX2]